MITTAEAQKDIATIIVTYDLGADDNYISKVNRARAQILILQKSTKRVNVATGGTHTTTTVTQRKQQKPTHSKTSRPCYRLLKK